MPDNLRHWIPVEAAAQLIADELGDLTSFEAERRDLFAAILRGEFDASADGESSEWGISPGVGSSDRYSVDPVPMKIGDASGILGLWKCAALYDAGRQPDDDDGSSNTNGLKRSMLDERAALERLAGDLFVMLRGLDEKEAMGLRVFVDRSVLRRSAIGAWLHRRGVPAPVALGVPREQQSQDQDIGLGVRADTPSLPPHGSHNAAAQDQVRKTEAQLRGEMRRQLEDWLKNYVVKAGERWPLSVKQVWMDAKKAIHEDIPRAMVDEAMEPYGKLERGKKPKRIAAG